ncbi:uncharacterized protein N7479_002330 [Penicillium vulpinum]|uniref:Uncharacterized protein n=1 Tax=Penicillium vulpinum TaxID=29845 RepID=A0A1V6S6R6_9EURO|nr:uncharacterized protein N7479_002330 [Penicillium vulpinum]KAJ5972412.1 hypothetical protein N7479_002330 [Penicillium vulpinum]OQE09737.1 hypothetical protein PENVUL_c005G06502 [Penicillium vulpinum]
MFKKIRHTLMCFPRSSCNCDSDTDSDTSEPQPNRLRKRPLELARRQSVPRNVVRIPSPVEPKAGGEGGEGYEDEAENGGEDGNEDQDGDRDEDISEDYVPLSPTPSEVEVSHTGITPAMSETNINDESSSDEYYSSTRHTNRPPQVSDTHFIRSSSGDEVSSVSAANVHTGITPEMSDTGLSDSQYYSLPDSRGSSLPESTLFAGEYNTDEDYNGADDDSLDLNRSDDQEMYDDSVEPEESESSDQEWLSDSSDRRRRRSIDSQARADAEHRGLSGSRGSSGSSKRQRLAGSSDIASGRVKTGIEPTVEDITRYRNIGAQYQAWIDDPEEPGCRIQPATLTIEELTDGAQQMPWTIDESYFTVEPMALEGGDVESMNIARGGPRYRYTHIRRDPGPNSLDANEFEHRVARGVLVAERLSREDGPHWNEIARAQYLLDFNLLTLRHVLFTDIGNDQTAPYIRHELYPRRFGIEWSEARDVDCMVFKHGSAEYQELLGTKLGKGVACLILSSFPRGTMKITRIVTWSNATLPQMRFEIEPVIAAPIAVGTAA